MPRLHFNPGNHFNADWFATQQSAKQEAARRRTGRNTFGTGEEQQIIATSRDDDYHSDPDGVRGYITGVDPGFDVIDLQGHTDLHINSDIVMHLDHTGGAAGATCTRRVA